MLRRRLAPASRTDRGSRLAFGLVLISGSGFSASVAVAWWAALYARPTGVATSSDNCVPGQRQPWPLDPDAMGGLSAWWLESHELWKFGPKQIVHTGPSPLRLRMYEIDALDAGLVEQCVGWPLPCLTSIKPIGPESQRTETLDAIPFMRRGLELPSEFMANGSTVVRALPLQPMPCGLVLNTLFFGVSAWGLWIGWRAFMRWKRRRGRCCLGCGYPRQELPHAARCPECGMTNPNSGAVLHHESG